MIKKRILPVFQIAMLIVGTVVGAGFASGRELATFFCSYGKLGIIAAPIAAVLFAGVAIIFLLLGKKYAPIDLSYLNKQCFKRVGGVADMIMLFNCAVIGAGMLAALNNIGVMIFPKLSLPIFALVAAVLCAAVLIKGAKGLLNANSIISSLVFVFLAVTTIWSIAANIKTSPTEVKGSLAPMLFANIIIYVAMNMLLAGGTLATIEQKSKGVLIAGGILGGIIIGVLMLLIMIAITKSNSLSEEMPVLSLAEHMNPVVFYAFAAVMILGVFSTLLSAVYNVSLWMEGIVKNKLLAICITLMICLAVSFFGFSKIVDYLYPIFGVVGVVYIIVCSLSLLPKKNKGRLELT